MNSMLPRDQLLEVLNCYRGSIGEVRHIAVLEVPVVSSVVYRVDTDTGKYCLKVPLYGKVKKKAGTEEELESWRLIANLRQKLYEKGVLVEEQVAADDGSLVLKHGAHYYWVSRYYESTPFTGNPDQLVVAGLVLGSYHAMGRELMAEDRSLCDRVARHLYRDMPLDESLKTVTELEAALFDRDLPKHYPHCVQVADVLEDVKRLYKKEVKPKLAEFRHAKMDATRDSLVHNDFHPGNILFRPDGREAVILDLEQATIGPQMKCVSFSLCRFSFEARKAGGVRSVRDGARSFVEGYCKTNALSAEELASVPFWIQRYELEKILRILRKFIFEGLYPQNVRRLVTHHIPIFRDADQFAID